MLGTPATCHRDQLGLNDICAIYKWASYQKIHDDFFVREIRKIPGVVFISPFNYLMLFIVEMP